MTELEAVCTKEKGGTTSAGAARGAWRCVQEGRRAISSSAKVEEEAPLTEAMTWILRSLSCRKTWSPIE